MQVQSEVKVTLLLGGGHSRTVAMSRQDPLLRALIGTIQDKSRGIAQSRPYHLRVDGGRQSFMFSGSDLVGILTDPPVAFDRAAGEPETAAPVHKSRWIIVENFLPPEQHQELLALVGRDE